MQCKIPIREWAHTLEHKHKVRVESKQPHDWLCCSCSGQKSGAAVSDWPVRSEMTGVAAYAVTASCYAPHRTRSSSSSSLLLDVAEGLISSLTLQLSSRDFFSLGTLNLTHARGMTQCWTRICPVCPPCLLASTHKLTTSANPLQPSSSSPRQAKSSTTSPSTLPRMAPTPKPTTRSNTSTRLPTMRKTRMR